MSFRLGIVSLAACLVWCTAAFASSVQYNGPAGAGHGAGVEFGAKQVHSRPTLVRRFEFHNIPAACKGYAATAVTGMLTITMKVGSDRRFSGAQSLNGGRYKVTVSGSVRARLPQGDGNDPCPRNGHRLRLRGHGPRPLERAGRLTERRGGSGGPGSGRFDRDEGARCCHRGGAEPPGAGGFARVGGAVCRDEHGG